MMERILEIALNEGFSAASIVETEKMVFNPVFVQFCAENLCGNYDANYSCPPACGTPQEMQRRMQGYPHALVLQTKWPIADYSDWTAIRAAKAAHNAAMFRVIEELETLGLKGIMGGASNCTLCSPCRMVSGESCLFPEKRFSCLSAYCINVSALAEMCGMEYSCSDGQLAFFGVYAFGKA